MTDPGAETPAAPGAAADASALPAATEPASAGPPTEPPLAPAVPPVSGPPETSASETPALEAQAESGKVEVPDGVESTLPSDVPTILLPLFEGPLDLLLYLIRKERLDIHDIPIAPITRMYMEYLDLMRELNLELAGDFLVMAATLIHIKSKMLVPIAPTEAAGDEEYEDPREELMRRLIEFQRYKEAAGILHQKLEIRAATWTRPDSAVPRFDETGEEMIEAGLYDLISAFKELLERRKVLLAHEVEAEGKTVEQRMDELLAMIPEGSSLEFLELFAALETKDEMVVTFLALLELVRLKQIKVYQRGIFGPIRVFRLIGPSGPTNPAVPAPEA